MRKQLIALAATLCTLGVFGAQSNTEPADKSLKHDAAVHRADRQEKELLDEFGLSALGYSVDNMPSHEMLRAAGWKPERVAEFQRRHSDIKPEHLTHWEGYADLACKHHQVTTWTQKILEGYCQTGFITAFIEHGPSGAPGGCAPCTALPDM